MPRCSWPGCLLIAELDAEGAALAAVAADLVLTGVMLRAVRHVGDGRVGVEGAYLARYAAALAAGGGVALAVVAVGPAVIAAVAGAAAFTGAGVRAAPRAVGADRPDPAPLISRAAPRMRRIAAARPRCTGRDSRRAHGSPSARGRPGELHDPAQRLHGLRPDQLRARGEQALAVGLAAAAEHLDDAVRDGVDVAVRRRVTPPSQRSISSLSSSPAVHTAGTPAQKQSSSRVRNEKLDSR